MRFSYTKGELMTAFEYDDYKAALRGLLNDRKTQFGSRFTFDKMAAACGIQKTYLSKVLNTDAHLNADQLFSALEFLKLPLLEQEYVSLLNELQRSANSKRAVVLRTRLQNIRRKQLRTENSIKVDEHAAIRDRMWEYYSDIDLQLVHLFLTVTRFAEEPKLICAQVGITEKRLDSILIQLQNWKIAGFDGSKYHVSEPRLHIPEDSQAFATYRVLNRVKTLERITKQQLSGNGDYFFSAVLSAEKSFQDKFRKRLLTLLKETQADVVNAKAEEIYQINIDFYRWS